MSVESTQDRGEKKVPIVEIFGPTIQGEGSVIGYQTIFVRLGGCDYRCERCDSLHAVLPEVFSPKANWVTQEDMAQTVWDWTVQNRCQHTQWITLSGGNPCMWPIEDFVIECVKADKLIAVETQGTLMPRWLDFCTKITVSPKGPGMGEKFEPEKFAHFVERFGPNSTMFGGGHPGFSVKVVIFDQRDLEMVVEILTRWPELDGRMFLSVGNVMPPAPAKRNGGEMSYEEHVQQQLESYKTILEDVLQDPRLASVRILPQLHCLLWGNRQGV